MARRFRGVPWTNLVNVVESGDRLIKYAGAASTWDAGADTRGVRTIPAGRDGYIEFRAETTIAALTGPPTLMVGLSATGTSANYTDIQFAIHTTAAIPDHFYAYEDGVQVYDGGAASLAPGDLLRVERIGTAIFYKKNGVTQYTHTIAGANATAALYADASFSELASAAVAWRFSIDELDDAAPICAPLRGVGHLAVVVAVAFPSGTRRYSTSPISSATDGHYSQRLVSVDRISRSIGSRNYGLDVSSTRVVVADEDGSLAQLLATERAHWSAVTIESASQDVANASWLTEKVGRLNSWEQGVPVDGVPTMSLEVSNDDLALRSPSPDGTITNADFPSIAPEAIGTPERLVFGRQHSQGIAGTAGGTIEAVCVQPWNGSSWVGYVANGIPRIVQVFVGGVAQTTAGAWSAPVLIRGARWLQTISLTADPGSSKVTVDVDGYDWTAIGAGWGNYIGGPEHWADVMRFWLTNFVFQRWKIGTWLAPDASKIDLASLSDVKLALGRVAAGRVLEGGRSAIDSLNESCASVGVYPIFTREGRIGFVLDDPLVSASDQYNAPLILAQRAGEMRTSWPGNGITKRITVSFAESQAEGRFLGTHEVQDPDVSVESSRTIEAPWTPTMLLTPPSAIVLNDAGADPVLTCWIRSKSMLQDYNPGDAIGTVRDLSGQGHDWTQATGSKQPKFRFFPQEERAWMEFDGSNDQLDAFPAALSNFKVAGGWTMLVAFRVRSFAPTTKLWTAGGYCELLLNNAPSQVYFHHFDGGGGGVDVLSPALVPNTWYVACCRHVGGKVYLGINDARKQQIGIASNGNTASLASNVSLGGAGANYAAVDVAELIVFKDDAGENTLRAMDYMLSEHVFRYKSALYGVKDMASRDLGIYRRPRMMVTLDAAPELSVMELGSLVRVQHPLGSAPGTVGWGASGWSARPFRIVSMDRDPIANTLELGLADVHGPCVTWRDTGITLRGVDTGKADWARQEGVARLG